MHGEPEKKDFIGLFGNGSGVEPIMTSNTFCKILVITIFNYSNINVGTGVNNCTTNILSHGYISPS